MATPHTRLIVDDHPVVLSGLRLLLGHDPRFAIVGDANNGKSGSVGLKCTTR